MGSDFHIRTECRLCASPDLTRLLTLPDTPLANELSKSPEGGWSAEGTTSAGQHWHTVQQADRFPLHLVGCRACGHVQLPVEVDPKRLFPPDYAYQSGTSAVFREHLKELAETLAGQLKRGAGVLDVACNDGTFVTELRAQGLSAIGVDPAAPVMVKHMHRAFFNEEWANTYVSLAGSRGDVGYSCITALNVFAHLPDMDDFTRGVKAVLEPCGLFVAEVGYLKDVVEKGRFSTIYHEHTAYHHLGPLVRFFRKHGMTLVDAERIESQGGSIRLYVRNCDKTHQGGDDGHNVPSDQLQSLLDEESRSYLWDGVKLLGNVKAGWGVRGARDQLKAMAPLVCYGAPAKLCTLLHATGQTDAMEYVVDSNPRKQGRFIPGTKIPILDPSVLYERRPKRILVTAWNFFEDIKRQHADLGCDWVVSNG